MKVIIIGCGEVGRHIARHLLQENHSLVMIDKNQEVLTQFAENMDVQIVHGLGCRPDELEQAGAHKADLLIAVTNSDEINMMACQMAHSLFKVPKKIARVHDTSYLGLAGRGLYSPDNMPVDVIISPEMEVAKAIQRTLFVPGAFDASPFANDKLMLIGCYVGRKSPLIKQKLNHWEHHNANFKPLVIFRGGRSIIPKGQDHLEEQDEIYFLSKFEEISHNLALLGRTEKPVKNAFVVGGGAVGFHLCRYLEQAKTSNGHNANINLRILEKDLEHAKFLANELQHTTVLVGDALNKELMLQENINKMDTALAVTSDDAVNILTSIMARNLGVKNVLTLIHKPDFISLAESVGLNKVLSPQQVTVSKILQHVRRGQVSEIHTLHSGQGEVLELCVSENSPLIGRSMDELELPEGAVVGALIRPSGHVIMPHEGGAIHPDTKVLIFASNYAIAAVEEIFA